MFERIVWRACATLLAGMTLCGCLRVGPGVPPVTATKSTIVHVAAAVSTTEAVTEVAQSIQKSHPEIQIKLNFGATSNLAKQIEAGAPTQVFLSASADWAKQLAEQRLVAEQVNLLGNRLVVVVSAESSVQITTIEDLAQPGQARLAIADPSGVPAGVYAEKALQRAGLYGKLAGRLVLGGDVRETLALVEAGAADMGIVYATDAAISKGVKIAWEFPEEDSADLVYTLIRIQGEASLAADQIFAELQSATSQRAFEKQGFRWLKSKSN